jgi:acyl carrier protein
VGVQSLEGKLGAWIGDRTGLAADEIDENTALFSSGLLDSFDLLDFVSMLEVEIGRKIRPIDINLDNFDSPAKVKAFVTR